ncbi:MAG TPA: glycosyltransferase family 39 protein [Vicinamibacterales bacterium]|nr:glycosyltransferase family 39 protein [Vicinamibacterales bacterium]
MPAAAERLLSGRDRLAWLAAFLGIAALLVLTRFSSTDPDSALYAGLADRLSHEPVQRWLAPEWWGFWPDAQMEGFFREHPAGVFLLPAALGTFGVPPLQGAYVVGVAAGLASLILMASLIHRLADRGHARVALVLLQLMPVAFIFRIRANHEYPMLVCLLVAVHGLFAASMGRPFFAFALVALGLSGALLIKGVFATNILIAIAIWILVNPIERKGARRRAAVAAVAGVLVMAGVAVGYDFAYRGATGEPFWSLYWQRQIGPLADVGPIDVALSFGRNILFYTSRLVWHPAPWSVALIVLAWRMRDGFRTRWIALHHESRARLLFVLLFAAAATLLVSPVGRYAERYGFPAVHAIACLGVVAAASVWPAIVRPIGRLDARMPALPVLVWIVLMVLRLGIGSLLPRIS